MNLRPIDRKRTTRSRFRILRTRLAEACAISFLMLSLSVPATPQSSGSKEYELKAAFLLNFAKFIDWPPDSFASATSPFLICVVGQDPFGTALNQSLLGKTMDGRVVQIIRYPNMGDLPDARHCQIVFVSASEKSHFRDVIGVLRGANTLMVGDADGFAAAGGTIEFMLEDNHIRFAINPDAAERADLKISSKLLALAKIVHEGPTNGKS
jgi:uncharacterized protein DUF4154